AATHLEEEEQDVGRDKGVRDNWGRPSSGIVVANGEHAPRMRRSRSSRCSERNSQPARAEAASSGSRIDGRRDLIPDLNFVTVRIVEEDVRFARNELALLTDDSAGFLNGLAGLLDVGRPSQPKAEMGNTSGLSGIPGFALEHEHVTTSWRLRLNKRIVLIDG